MVDYECLVHTIIRDYFVDKLETTFEFFYLIIRSEKQNLFGDFGIILDMPNFVWISCQIKTISMQGFDCD